MGTLTPYASPGLYGEVTGQDRAVAALRAAASKPVHAYLLVGPAGTGKRAAARSFAASLLCPDSHDPHHRPDGCDCCRRVMAGLHPDVIDVEREGASIGIDSAREVTRISSMSPVEGDRKVVVLHDFHLVRDTGPALLKTIEEPPASTVFVILAEYLPPELATIASRCGQVNFDPLSPGQVAAALVREGIDGVRAAELAEASGGRLDRARLLASDTEFEVRRGAWRGIPARLDGSGATAAAIADELLGYLESSVAPLKARHSAEMVALVERNQRAAEVVSSGAGKGRGGKSGGARASKAALSIGVKDLEERHRRAERRQRTDELRSGLATLAAAYRQRLTSSVDPRRQRAAMESITRIDSLSRDLTYNPGELLALQALLARLGRIAVNA